MAKSLPPDDPTFDLITIQTQLERLAVGSHPDTALAYLREHWARLGCCFAETKQGRAFLNTLRALFHLPEKVRRNAARQALQEWGDALESNRERIITYEAGTLPAADSSGGKGVAESAEATPLSGEAPSGYTVAALRRMTGLGNTALNGYAKRTSVTTPKRGQRDFRYSSDDVRRILRRIIAETSEDELLAKCKTALANLKEVPE